MVVGLNDVVASSQAQLIRYVFRIKAVFGISRFRILLLFEINIVISGIVEECIVMSNFQLCHQLYLIPEYEYIACTKDSSLDEIV